MAIESARRPSLEALIEAEDLGLEILHPGGLQITRELGELCRIGPTSRVLDVASGTGESACFLAENFGCAVTGVDASDFMLNRAIEKARNTGANIEFKKGDAQNLPFEADTFDAVISECTTCILEKQLAISEMMRVATPGGYVGIHDLCWKQNTPERMRWRLAEIEGEVPETLDGWKRIFEEVGLEEVVAVDKSFLMRGWGMDIKRKLGSLGQFRIFLKVSRKWGIGGLKRIIESARIFESEHTGYGIIVGRKPRRMACRPSNELY